MIFKKVRATLAVTLALSSIFATVSFAESTTRDALEVTEEMQTERANNGPLEYCFGSTDAGWTVETATYVHEALDRYGYYNQYSYDDNRASTVASCMTNSAITFIGGHGAPGCIATQNMTNPPVKASNKVPVSGTSLPTNIGKTLLVYFQGCQTAISYGRTSLVDANEKGFLIATGQWQDYVDKNLLEKSVENGAKVAIGYEREIDAEGAMDMSKKFFERYLLERSMTVADAMNAAWLDYSENFYYVDGNLKHYCIVGNANLKIRPARYGN